MASPEKAAVVRYVDAEDCEVVEEALVEPVDHPRTKVLPAVVAERPTRKRSCCDRLCRYLCCLAPARCERRSARCAGRWTCRVFAWFLFLVACGALFVWETRLRRRRRRGAGSP